MFLEQFEQFMFLDIWNHIGLYEPYADIESDIAQYEPYVHLFCIANSYIDIWNQIGLYEPCLEVRDG